MKYIEKFSLYVRGAVDQLDDDPVDGTLLIGENPAAEWYKARGRYGGDAVKLFPAFHNGERCFVVRKTWCPAHGYSATGVSEQIVPLIDGLKMATDHGVIDNLFRIAEQP